MNHVPDLDFKAHVEHRRGISVLSNNPNAHQTFAKEPQHLHDIAAVDWSNTCNEAEHSLIMHHCLFTSASDHVLLRGRTCFVTSGNVVDRRPKASVVRTESLAE